MNSVKEFTNDELKLLQSALYHLRNEILADKNKYSEIHLYNMEDTLMSTYEAVWNLYCKISVIIDKSEEEM